MKRISILTVFLLALLISIAIPTASRADSRERREAIRHCKQEYNESMERARHMRGRERREAVERAKRNRDRCMNEGRR
jgi:vacuolar-type H+-ATPase subunit H